MSLVVTKIFIAEDNPKDYEFLERLIQETNGRNNFV